MTLRVSTGFKSKILGPYSFPDIFDGGVIRIFSGAQPASADDAEQGTLIGVVTLNGEPWTAGTALNGLTFVLSGPFAAKMPLEAWSYAPLLDATLGWFRLVGNAADTGGPSFSLPRIDGAFGLAGSGAEYIEDSLAAVTGESRDLSGFFYTILPLVGV